MLRSTVFPPKELNPIQLMLYRVFHGGSGEAIKYITELYAYGGCVQDGTPTPSAPVDIVCNNGTIKAKHESGLPIEYQKVEYIESSGTQYVDIRYIPDGNEIIELTFDIVNLPIQNKWIILFGEREQAASNSQTNYWLGINYTGTLYSRFGTENVSSQPTLTSGTTYNIKVDIPNRTLYVNNNSYTFTNSVISGITRSIFLGNINASISAVLNLAGTTNYRSMKITKNDNILHNFIPCYRKSDNEAGLYDIVTNTFFANAGTGAFTVSSDVADPVEVSADGTSEVLTIVSETTQTASVENLFGVGDYKDEQEIISGAVTKKCGIKVLNGTEEWTTDTYGGSRRFVNYNFAKQELSTVLCTHFSSTADDGARISPGNAYVAATGALVIYKAESQSIDTVADWKSFLSAQYAAGTPVIVVYLLAQETTEQVTAQPVKGTSAAITQASIDNLEISVITS